MSTGFLKRPDYLPRAYWYWRKPRLWVLGRYKKYKADLMDRYWFVDVTIYQCSNCLKKFRSKDGAGCRKVVWGGLRSCPDEWFFVPDLPDGRKDSVLTTGVWFACCEECHEKNKAKRKKAGAPNSHAEAKARMSSLMATGRKLMEAECKEIIDTPCWPDSK